MQKNEKVIKTNNSLAKRTHSFDFFKSEILFEDAVETFGLDFATRVINYRTMPNPT